MSTHLFSAHVQADRRLFPLGHRISLADGRAWLRSQNLKMVDDVLLLWAQHGGGDFLETETLLLPDRFTADAESIESVTEYNLREPISNKYYAIHIGICTTLVERETGALVAMTNAGVMSDRAYADFDKYYYDNIYYHYRLTYPTLLSTAPRE